MLQDPSAYLLERNKALLKAASITGNIYKNVMTDVVKAVAGTSEQERKEYKAAAGQAWVKSLGCIDTAMLTFRGGREVQAFPDSNNQAVLEINESLGLGMEQFLAGKKIHMLRQNICKTGMKNLLACPQRSKPTMILHWERSKHLQQAMRTPSG